MSSLGNMTDVCAEASTCSACEGPLPWVEENPHAHEANGQICKVCGHFYVISPFGGKRHGFIPLLFSYCAESKWDWALARLRFAPEEASFVYGNGGSALQLAIHYGADMELIRGLVEAVDPEAMEPKPTLETWGIESVDSPIWSVLSQKQLNQNTVEICKTLLSKNTKALLSVPSEGRMESPLGEASSRYHKFFLEAAADTNNNTPGDQQILDTYGYQTNSGRIVIQQGALRHAFDLWSILVKASYYGKLDEDILKNKPVLHAIAGCRDPYFVQEGFPVLAAKLLSAELVQKNEIDGNTPLHIAAATINRDKKEYFDWPSFCDAGYAEEHRMSEEHSLQYAREKFLGSFCKHGRLGAEESLNNCHCPQEYEKANQLLADCHCGEAFHRYYAKMNNEHRNDKKAVIEAFVKANPEAASIRNHQGQLPIHLAVGKGKKCWEGAVRVIAQAYPEGVGILDPQNGLYPFMAVAATGIDDLDTCFELLRFRPQILNWCGFEQGEGEKKSGTKRKRVA